MGKSKREIETIYARAVRKDGKEVTKVKSKVKKTKPNAKKVIKKPTK